MYIRRKPNKTGTTSIQVVSKAGGKYKVVRSFGVGRTEQELVRLEEHAREFVCERRGFTGELFVDEDEVHLEDFVSTLQNTQIQVIGPELIFGCLYDRIGYGKIKNELFRHLVVSRLFSPGSKLKTIDCMERFQGIIYSRDKIYRFMDTLCEKEKKEEKADIKTEVEQIAFEHTRRVLRGKIRVVFYDMTTLYFEAADEDDLRKTGFSKDGKQQCPQIFLGLLTTGGGNPPGYEIFEGNIFEGHTFIPVLQNMEKKYPMGKPIVVADAGLLSDKNRRALESSGYTYILGARVKNSTTILKEQVSGFNLNSGEAKAIKQDNGTRLIVSMSDKRAGKDKHNREKGLARLQKRIRSGKLAKSGINNRGYNKYLKLEGEVTITLDKEKFAADAAWDGIKGYVTNTKLPVKKVIENYGNLWYIERAFRMNKTDLRIRPIYHHLRNRMEGHICICFTAYTVLLEMERMLKQAKSDITLKRAQELTKTMYQLTYRLPKSRLAKTKILGMTSEQQHLYDIVVRWSKRK
ncbi:MAG: IS1634 family transposase [Dysgonamonadaceae bacterium]|jgi:transposase|nr:IS1634 family transposase [Dysgonamonadaceae bacterium]